MLESARTTFDFDRHGNITATLRSARTHRTPLAGRAAAYEDVPTGWHAHDATDDLLPGVQGWHVLVLTLPILNKIRAIVVSPAYMGVQSVTDVLMAGIADRAEAEQAQPRIQESTR
ncbi:hypothetical protein [Rhodococcus daqingensis]|uniref:Uncharacterized protein n=1 Tax=Rhodococcus daqingensis TaxID=2479363 RepID=A0ABW2S3Z1_9NOCA